MEVTNTDLTDRTVLDFQVKALDAIKRNYFYWASVFLLILSVVAFSDNLFYDVKQKSNSDPNLSFMACSSLPGLLCWSFRRVTSVIAIIKHMLLLE